MWYIFVNAKNIPGLGLWCQAFLLTNYKKNIIWNTNKVSAFLCLFSLCDLWQLLVTAHVRVLFPIVSCFKLKVMLFLISIYTDGLHFICYQSTMTFLRTYLLEHSICICLDAYISPLSTLAALEAHVEWTDVAICLWCLRHQVVLTDELYLADSIWEWTQLNWKWKYGYSTVAITYLCCDFIFLSDFTFSRQMSSCTDGFILLICVLVCCCIPFSSFLYFTSF